MTLVLSSLAFASTLEALGVPATLMPTALLLPRIRAGEAGDVAILTAEGIDALAAEGALRPGSRRDLARSFVGIAVRAGAVRPRIDTEAALVEALLAARSVALSRAGASGLFFAGLLERLGIAAAVMDKAVVIESGYTAALAADGRAELAVQQVSELLMVPGIDLVGPLPPECGGAAVFSGAVLARATAPAEGGALLARIAAAGDVLRRCGLAPV